MSDFFSFGTSHGVVSRTGRSTNVSHEHGTSAVALHSALSTVILTDAKTNPDCRSSVYL
jgi:hypothetical protein